MEITQIRVISQGYCGCSAQKDTPTQVAYKFKAACKTTTDNLGQYNLWNGMEGEKTGSKVHSCLRIVSVRRSEFARKRDNVRQ